MRYEAPESLDTAVASPNGAKGDARVLAWGTALLVQMDPELIVDMKKIPGGTFGHRGAPARARRGDVNALPAKDCWKWRTATLSRPR
jgi:hypothetical protein